MKHIILLFSCIICAFAQPKVEWNRTHSTEGTFSIDKARFIVTDKIGAVIVTGVTNPDGVNEDITTIKYDKDGNLLWIAVYNGPGNYKDYPVALSADAAGNVYITGGSTGEGTATDFVTIKYSPAGNMEWAQRYASEGGLFDQPYSMAVDDFGNVYVTGAAAHYVTYNSGSDWITIKYNTNGKQVWIQGYDDGITDDRGTALSIDELGNVYAAGQCRGPSYHIGIIKYDSAGTKQWITKYDGEKQSDDRISMIKPGGDGNICVTGYSSEKNTDILTMKLNTEGEILWKKSFSSPENSFEEAASLITDNSGNIYVLGLTGPKLDKKLRCIIKYNSSGEQQWSIISQKFVSRNIGEVSMTLDKNGSLLVTGSSLISATAPTEMVIDCFSPEGILKWQAGFSEENAIPVSGPVTTDDNGNIFITGYITQKQGFANYCTVKFKP